MTYALLVQNLDGEERKKFDRDLNGDTDADRVIADLLGMQAPRSGGGS